MDGNTVPSEHISLSLWGPPRDVRLLWRVITGTSSANETDDLIVWRWTFHKALDALEGRFPFVFGWISMNRAGHKRHWALLEANSLVTVISTPFLFSPLALGFIAFWSNSMWTASESQLD